MRKNSLLIRLLIFCLLYCGYIQAGKCQENDTYAGKYKYSFDQKFPSDTTVLYLHTNGRFGYFPYTGYSTVGAIQVCDSTTGYWMIKGNSIILNSDFKKTDYVKIISEYEQKDSVKIRIVNYSNGNPLSGMDIALSNEKNKTIIFRQTDEDGIVVIPSNNYKIVLYSPNIYTDISIPKLKGGYYYQFTDADCIPEIFDNTKLEIKGDTLIMHEKVVTDYDKRGRKIYSTFKYEYIKVRPSGTDL